MSVGDLAEAARTFDALSRCVADFEYGPVLFANPTGISTAALQLQLPAAQRWIGELDKIGVMNWPDTRWAVRLRDARATAATRLRALTASLYSAPTEPGTMRHTRATALVADAGDLAEAVRMLRDLIVQNPDVRRAL